MLCLQASHIHRVGLQLQRGGGPFALASGGGGCREMCGSMTCNMLCESLCWPWSRRRPGGKVPHWALHYNWAAGPRPDLSRERAAALVQPELQGLPLSTQLKDVLYQRPAAKLPVHRKALAGLSADLEVLCEQDDGSHLTLAAAVTAAMSANLRPGKDYMTARLIDKFLIELLVEGLDELLPAQQRLGVMVLCDGGDTDSTMTRCSDKGKSLRPDGQLRSGDGQRLLFKWEERAAGVQFQEAVEDLTSEATGLKHNPALTWPACPSSIVHLQCGLSKSRCCNVKPAKQVVGYRLHHGHLSLARQRCRHKLRSLLTAEKTAAWSPLYYAELPYLVTAAAAGAQF